MALDENVSALIGRIYESVDDPIGWQNILVELKTLMNASSVHHSVVDLRHPSVSRSEFLGPERAHDGFAEWASIQYLEDPVFQFAVENPNARFCGTEDVISKDEYLEHPFIRWLRDVVGSTHGFVGFTAPENELTFGITVLPPSSAGPLTSDKKALFKMLFEHMDRAIRLFARPPLLASTQEALIVLDRLGRIRNMSPAAEELIEQQDGLTVWEKQLRALDSASTTLLDQAILSALSALRDGGFGGAVALPRRSGRRDLLVTVSPLVHSPSPFEAFRPAALVRIVDPELSVPVSAPARWTCLFNLTPAEARLAEALMASDQNLRHAAGSLGISYSTARVHLKHLLEKTGTHGQSQLAKLLSRVS